FFIKRKIQFTDYVYRGKASDSPTVSIALANSGSMQIELLQQHDEKPSLYREFIEKKAEGLQHMASWYTKAGFDEKRSQLLEQGYKIAQECTIPSSGVRLVYFDTEADNGVVFEIADLLEPGQYERVMGIVKAAENWAGDQAVREVLQ
ncbi:MAG: VOC family protein, partial [Gammaproteobacteria bacterium]|nr:VOC family protein [Gammaproteobacteria bacterium]